MGSNRIQKLLFTEYSDFEDMVLLESPFAQTTREGRGIRQVQIGLTPSKLILASDYLYQEDPRIRVNPEISTLELLSMFPVECVNMSVFRRRTRNTLKAHFCNEQVLYFELASPERREMFWNLWCERVKFLTPDLTKSTASETSIGSSSSSSTCYFKNRTKCWHERDLFLGNNFGRGASKSKFNQSWSRLHILPGQSTITDRSVNPIVNSVCLVNRFGAGIHENCATNLFLPATICEESKINPPLQLVNKKVEIKEILNSDSQDKLRMRSNKKQYCRHRRRYGIAPMGLHLSGLGSVSFSKSEAFSTQTKRWASEVYLNRTDDLEIFGLPKRQLISTLSYDCLLEEIGKEGDYTIRSSLKYYYPPGSFLFWTPQYVYQPLNPYRSYKDLKTHLYNIQNPHNPSVQIQLFASDAAKNKLSIWCRNIKKKIVVDRGGGGDADKKSSHSSIAKLLKSHLTMDITLSSWDFDSTLFSYQLTIIDRDLFLKITPIELRTLLYERTSLNAPNISKMVKFSERICNLIASEIIRVDSVKMRARLISKYINAADKLHRLHNMHSTKSILLGLQHPAVYRLKKTWQCLRQHHSSKYQRLYMLLKIYKEARGNIFCQIFEKYSRTAPYIPSIHFLLGGLLGHLPNANSLLPSTSYNSILEGHTYINNMISPWSVISKTSLNSEGTRTSCLSFDSEDVLCQLDNYFKPLKENEMSPSQRLELAIVSLKMWQQAATAYELFESPLAKEFLLKARYLEGYEIYSLSLNIEPPELPV